MPKYHGGTIKTIQNMDLSSQNQYLNRVNGFSVETEEMELNMNSVLSVSKKLEFLNIDLKDLEKYNIKNINLDDIQSVSYTEDSATISLGIVDINYSKKNEKYVLSEIKYHDGTLIYCDIPETRKKQIRESIELSDDVKINGYSIIEVNDEKMYLYWIGNKTVPKNIHDSINNIKQGLSKYPKSALKIVLDSPDFKGFFVGEDDVAPECPDIEYAAYASYNKYIYINSKCVKNDLYSVNSIIHEFAHELDNTIVNDIENLNYSYEDKDFLKMYDLYKIDFQRSFKEIGYDSERFPDGVPNSAEFFAVSSEIYFSRPDDLKKEYPDLYSYMTQLFNNL